MTTIHREQYDQIRNAYLNFYGSESVCNDKEIRAILDLGDDEKILQRMRGRVGQSGLNPNKVKSDYFPTFEELPLIG